ncbi:hypothetical protein KC19_9G125200 [Ceratodon purpureus]|uniref:BZIP domain-containing protein n=1 Tax=Ceratodon purpureus TaxID=3225 RepID=A0A8T0GV06_CERPU|nr:hypothetical protein KC19_9G125200 [Ceratodon purpureus]
MDSSSFDLDFNLDSFPQLPSEEDLTSAFLKEDIETIDDDWWQGLCLPSPSRSVAGEGPLSAPEGGEDDGTVTLDGAASSSHSSCNLDVVVGGSSPEVVGSKRSAVSSPEIDQDDPKRARRLEKNREAASQSRARKKSYVKELEVKCRMLEAHVAQLQRVMTVTSMENSALKDELVRVKKPKDSVESGVAEPAVLESNSLPSEFLRHRSCHYHMGQYPTTPTAGPFQGFRLALLQLLMLAAVNGLSDHHQTSPPQSPLEGRISFPAVELYSGVPLEGGMVAGRIYKKKRGRPRHSSNTRWTKRSSERRLPGTKRRRVKHLRSSRIL